MKSLLFVLLATLTFSTVAFASDYTFNESSQEEMQAVAMLNWNSLQESIHTTIRSLGSAGGTITDMGNYNENHGIVSASFVFSTEEGKTLIVECMYFVDWIIETIFDKSDGHYYYLGDDYLGEYDVYDYKSGNLSKPAINYSFSDYAKFDYNSPEAELLRSQIKHDQNLTLSGSLDDDVTGKWRVSLYSSATQFQDFALNYYNSFFESEDEIHAVINFAAKVTYRISYFAGMLDITAHDYVDKEERSAKLLFTGSVLGEFLIDCNTGEIQRIQ